MLGDGELAPIQATITLNSRADLKYSKFVADLGKRLLGERPRIYKRKDYNALILYYNGRFLVNFLVKIGLKIGNKVRQQIDAPAWIKNFLPYKIACLRGIMDTDGEIFLHKYKVNDKKYFYRKVCFVNRSIPLLNFVKNTLKELGFNPKLINNVANKRVWLYNSVEVANYLKKLEQIILDLESRRVTQTVTRTVC